MSVKKVVILGSTGSIGINTLNVIRRYPDKFKIVGLSAYNNFKLLAKQAEEFNPKIVALTEEGKAYFKAAGSFKTKIFDVHQQLEELVTLKDVDIVVIAMRGSAALGPFLAAVRASKRIAPANKEALVVAGDLLMRESRKSKAEIIPIDSEQSAIFQSLEGHNRAYVKKVLLTASGGALRDTPLSKFDSLSVKQILNHPTWKMGDKITVDSALLMNKGFEVIEAKRLFQLEMDQIEVVIHPESIIHSMVEYQDGSIIAQLGVTDMRIPIQYALTYPERFPTGLKTLDFCALSQLTFKKPDLKKFPALALAIDVGKKDGTLPSVLNAADEVAVEAFLAGSIKFTEIYSTIEKVIRKHTNSLKPNLAEILAADRWAREETHALIRK